MVETGFETASPLFPVPLRRAVQAEPRAHNTGRRRPGAAVAGAGPQTASPLSVLALLRAVQDEPGASNLRPLVARQVRALQATHGNQFVQRVFGGALKDLPFPHLKAAISDGTLTWKEFQTLQKDPREFTGAGQVRAALAELRKKAPTTPKAAAPRGGAPTLTAPAGYTISTAPFIAYRADSWTPGRHKFNRMMKRREVRDVREVANRLLTDPFAFADGHVRQNNSYLLSGGWDDTCGGYADFRDFVYRIDLGGGWNVFTPPSEKNKDPIIYADSSDLNSARRIAIDPRKATREVDFAFDIPLENIVAYKPKNGAFEPINWDTIESAVGKFAGFKEEKSRFE